MGPKDEPIGFAKAEAANLSAGRFDAALMFGGNIIRDSGVDGPYVVRNVRVRQISEFPFAEAEPVAVLLTTPNWNASAFGQPEL